MPDTQRSLAELQVLLADNVTKEISAQDLRDLMQSLLPPFGGLHIDTSQNVAIASAGVYVPVAITTIAQPLRDVTHNDAGRLTYTGRVPNHFHFASTLSFRCETNNEVIGFKIAVNGTPIDGSYTPRKVGTGSDVGTMALHWDMMLNPDDYVEMYVANTTDDSDVIMDAFYMFMLGMVM